jgi:hypothetical protein
MNLQIRLFMIFFHFSTQTFIGRLSDFWLNEVRKLFGDVHKRLVLKKASHYNRGVEIFCRFFFYRCIERRFDLKSVSPFFILDDQKCLKYTLNRALNISKKYSLSFHHMVISYIMLARRIVLC